MNRIRKLTKAVVATNNLGLKFSIINGGKLTETREQLLYDMNGIKHILRDKTNLKKYLLREFETFKEMLDARMLDEEVVLKVDKFSTPYVNVEKDVVPTMKKITSFSLGEIETTLSKKISSDSLLYMNAMAVTFADKYLCMKRRVNVWDNVSLDENETKVLGNIYKKLNEKIVLRLMALDGEKIKLYDIYSLEKLVNNIEDDKFVATLNYVSDYVLIGDKELSILANMNSQERKTLCDTLQRYYFHKVRIWNATWRKEEYMEMPINLFFANNGDVGMLRNFCKNVEKKYFDIACYTNLSYLDIACGGKYTNVVAKMPSVFEEILNYSLLNKKKGFLNLLNDNLEKILVLVKEKNSYDLRNSCLFKKEVYSNVLNLNEINFNDFSKLLDIKFDNGRLSRLFFCNQEWKKTTPKEFIEISTVSNEKLQYFYLHLLNGKVDNKLIILRQLKNLEIDFSEYGGENWKESFARIARKLEIKNLAKRLEKYPIPLESETLLKVLALEEKFEYLIAEAKTEVELLFIFRNKDNLDLTLSLEENIEKYIDVDEDAKNMMTRMNLSEEFLTQYEKTIRNFLLLGNATIVEKYCKGMDVVRINSILKIAKAEMSGQMELLKFHNLEKEIEMNLDIKVLDEWKKNRVIKNKSYFMYETYSFNDTMMIGDKPGHTCMNYSDGQYRSCLLANFDSNKKIIFVKKNGKIVGRAIIRLTKSLKSDEKRDTSLTFLDVDNKEVEQESREKLTIFLERPYFAYLNDSEKDKIVKYFVELVKEKALEMDARFLISSSYDYYTSVAEVKKQNMSIFISHTKNEIQYMDSFSGTNTASDEGGYKSCSCRRIV